MKTLGPARSRLIQEQDKEIEEIDKSIQEDQKIVDSENESLATRERASEKIQKKTERRNALVGEREQLEEGMTLWERVKEIFKKFGVTVTAILLTAGVTIGAVIGAITNSLKTLEKVLENGLKEIGKKKTASLLPGLLGSIVSFLFKAAGQAIGFLPEHTWLLILAVVAFLMGSYIKKRR